MILKELHKAYDKNYGKILEIISEMGGDKQIPYHRKRRTTLYCKLRELQKIEHRLSEWEEALVENQ